MRCSEGRDHPQQVEISDEAVTWLNGSAITIVAASDEVAFKTIVARAREAKVVTILGRSLAVIGSLQKRSGDELGVEESRF